MAQRSSFRVKPLTICLLVVGVALLVVGIVFFVEPGHHVRRGLLAIALAAACGIGAFFLQRRPGT
jgi:drug/metabolite transporter (DMT)-like permease